MSTYSLTWLPDVLLKAGLKVAPVDGWEYRGHDDMGPVYGVLIHHTAGPKDKNMPSLGTLVSGRPDLTGPLAHLGLGRDGTFYVIAAGKCNHAGAGSWKGVSSGNMNFIGIEAENTGLMDDPWPAVQIDALQFGVAAILRYLKRDVQWCAGHKEYAMPKGRKTDPSFDMAVCRAAVARIRASDTASLIPAVETTTDTTAPPRPTLRRGDKGPLVIAVQVKVGVSPADGIFGPVTEAAVRAFQRKVNLVPDGIVGPASWQAIGPC